MNHGQLFLGSGGYAAPIAPQLGDVAAGLYNLGCASAAAARKYQPVSGSLLLPSSLSARHQPLLLRRTQEYVFRKRNSAMLGPPGSIR